MLPQRSGGPKGKQQNRPLDFGTENKHIMKEPDIKHKPNNEEISKISRESHSAASSIIKTAVFVLAIITLLITYAPIIREHTGLSYRWKMFYQKARQENIDLMFLGTSHVYKTLDSRIFQKELGIPVYNMGMSAQPISQTYYDLAEVLKYTKPKLIIMDALMFNRIDPLEDREYFIFEEIASMKFSYMKIKNITDLFTPKDWINALFPAIREHDNWRHIDTLQRNIKFLLYNEHVAQETYFDGFVEDFTELSPENLKEYEETPYTEIEFTIDNKDMWYIKEINSICEQEGIELLFMNSAVPRIIFEKTNYMDRYNETKRVMEELDRPYIDFNLLYDEIGYDNTCFMDEYNITNHHMNSKGARLTSEYLAGYLKEHYNKELTIDK